MQICEKHRGLEIVDFGAPVEIRAGAWQPAGVVGKISEFANHFAIIDHAEFAPDVGVDVETEKLDGAVTIGGLESTHV